MYNFIINVYVCIKVKKYKYVYIPFFGRRKPAALCVNPYFKLAFNLFKPTWINIQKLKFKIVINDIDQGTIRDKAIMRMLELNWMVKKSRQWHIASLEVATRRDVQLCLYLENMKCSSGFRSILNDRDWQ